MSPWNCAFEKEYTFQNLSKKEYTSPHQSLFLSSFPIPECYSSRLFVTQHTIMVLLCNDTHDIRLLISVLAWIGLNNLYSLRGFFYFSVILQGRFPQERPADVHDREGRWNVLRPRWAGHQGGDPVSGRHPQKTLLLQNVGCMMMHVSRNIRL